ncbi:MAG: hypothetical protein ACXVRH_09290, partial [Thermoleophilaceae bacterium]
VIAEGEHGRRARAKVPVARPRVRSAQDELARLVDELLQPGPVDPAGVAQVRLLLSDGGGPLYNPRSDDDLRAAARAAVDALML